MEDVATKEYVSTIHEMGNELVEGLSHLYVSFIYDNDTFLNEAEEIIRKVTESEKELTDELITASEHDKTARLFAPVPTHMQRIAHNYENIARSIRKKIADKILFSVKAFYELNFLFLRTKEILTTTNDHILARNYFLADYINKSVHEIESTVDKFTTSHEERLIEGVCLPQASGLYIVMTDSIRRIAWNAKGIAEKLTKAMF